MGVHGEPTNNKFVYYARKIYNPLGFYKGYNFPLFILTVGSLMGFGLARFRYLNIDGYFMKNTIPGEQYWYQTKFRRVGIILHLATIIPACFLVAFQFIPVIRHKLIIFHRINGYLCVLLLLLSNAGAFMITRHAVGGAPILQTFIGILGVMTTVAVVLAYINIKALQIDQHRAWMMRAWAWAASIISLRLIQIAALDVLSKGYNFYNPITCAEIWFMYAFYAGVDDANNPTRLLYPQCTSSTSTVVVAVPTQQTRPGPLGPEISASRFRTVFALSGYVALVIHVVLMELYLALTPAESKRLRMVSYERQVQAGRLRCPEKGALTATRLGDAPLGWNSPVDTVEKRPSAGRSGSDLESDVQQAKANVPTGAPAV